MRSPEVARLFHPPAFGVLSVTHRLDRARVKLNEAARLTLAMTECASASALSRFAAASEFAFSSRVLGAGCRHSQRARRPAPLAWLECILPARSFALVHHAAAVVAIEHVFKHIAELPLALHRVPVRSHRRGMLFEGSAKAALGFGRQAPTGAGQHLRQSPLRHDRAGVHANGNERCFQRRPLDGPLSTARNRLGLLNRETEAQRVQRAVFQQPSRLVGGFRHARRCELAAHHQPASCFAQNACADDVFGIVLK